MARKPKSSSATTSSGGRANRTGNRLEEFVEHALRTSGYVEFSGNEALAFENRRALGGKQYIKQLVVGTTIYGSVRRCDFFIINQDGFPYDLVIECKWQQVGGSVDEKYPFLCLNIRKLDIPTVVLLDGGGYNQGAMRWLQEQVGQEPALLAVWTMTEFQKKVNDGFLE